MASKQPPPRPESERMSPVDLEADVATAYPPVLVPVAIESSHSQPTTEPAPWVYQALHIAAVCRIMIMAFSARLWVAALQWFVWSENPIEVTRNAWMIEVLLVTVAHLGVFFFFGVAGLGLWIGSFWSKAKLNPSLLEAQMTRIRRIATLIATYDLPAALCALLYATAARQGVGIILCICLLLHFGLSCMVVIGTRNKAQNAPECAMVHGDLEFTIHASMLLMASLAQIVAALVGLWVVVHGMEWSSPPAFFAGLGYMLGLLAAIVSGAISAEVSGKHVFRNKEGLVDKSLKPAFIINATNLALGGIVASFLRGWWALPDTFSVIPFLGYTLVIQGRMHYLRVRASHPDSALESSGIAAYIQQAQSNTAV